MLFMIGNLLGVPVSRFFEGLPSDNGMSSKSVGHN